MGSPYFIAPEMLTGQGYGARPWSGGKGRKGHCQSEIVGSSYFIAGGAGLRRAGEAASGLFDLTWGIEMFV